MPGLMNFPINISSAKIFLVAPVVWEGQHEIDVYLPEGEWYFKLANIIPAQLCCAAKFRSIVLPSLSAPIICVALNLAESLALGDSVGNAVEGYQKLVFRTYQAATKAQFAWFSDPDQPSQIFEISAAAG